MVSHHFSTHPPINGHSMPNKELSALEKGKQVAAYACADAHIHNGMRLGVGSGATIKFLIEWLKEKYSKQELSDIKCVPTSYQTRQQLHEAGLPVESLDTLNSLDLAIDGADEVDVNLTCIKGGGGCLLQEKIVQCCAKRFILIANAEKHSEVLGQNYENIPIEVVPCGLAPVRRWIKERHGGECVLRMDRRGCFPVITENHNFILDWHFPKPVAKDKDWHKAHQSLINIPGIVETGLFVGVAECAYFGASSGEVIVVNSNRANGK